MKDVLRAGLLVIALSCATVDLAYADPLPPPPPPADELCRPPPRYVHAERQEEPPGWNITWSPPLTAPVTGVEEYGIYRAINDSRPELEYILIAEVPEPGRYYFDPVMEMGIEFLYGVSAFNACGESAMVRANQAGYPQCEPVHYYLEPEPEVFVHKECMVPPVVSPANGGA